MIPVGRLVPYLVDHIRHAFVPGGHIRKEFHSLCSVESVRMPVHEDINAIGNGSVHYCTGALLSEFRILQVALCLTLAIVDFHSDRGTHKLSVPVLHDMLYRIGIVETRPEHIPSEAHAFELNGVPVLIHKGRIYKAFEYATHKVRKWGRRYSAMVISAPAGADLLDAKSWRCSNILYSDPSWLGGEFRGWLEGNMVYDIKNKQLLNILRVGTVKGVGVEHCARVEISPNGKQISFDTEKGFVPFPGGAKKFTIRYDERTGKYWTLVNNTDPEKLVIKNDKTRNTLSLYSSTDLLEWKRERTIIDPPDIYYHGVQYVDWQFEGEDIVAVIRTAWDDEEGHAHNQHDSNYILFRRIEKFAKN